MQDDSASKRIDLIRQIEKERSSRVLVYVCADRQNAPAQISDDAVRHMYDHLRGIGTVKKIDLFLYSRGGSVEVPWRIVTMLREHCEDLAALIPYKAHSAATLIALGCDEIVMGRKAELGPIDPAISRTRLENGVEIQEEIRVEDVMGYVNFLDEKAGLKDHPQGREQQIQRLAEQLTPTMLGHIYRTHTHIRMVADLMLACHKEALDKKTREKIITALAEKIPSHGHAVGRREAKEIGLNVINAESSLEEVMWNLLLGYEQEMEMLTPLHPDSLLEGKADDEMETDLVLAMLESVEMTSSFQGKMKVRRVRQVPEALNLNLNLQLSLPPGIDVNSLPAQAQQLLQAIVEQAQKAALAAAQKAMHDQCPVIRDEGRMTAAMWRRQRSAM